MTEPASRDKRRQSIAVAGGSGNGFAGNPWRQSIAAVGGGTNPSVASKGRRKTISVAKYDKENEGNQRASSQPSAVAQGAGSNNGEGNHRATSKPSHPMSVSKTNSQLPSTTPSKSPFRHRRTRLSASASHYFKGLQKTPGNTSFDISFDGGLSPYDGSAGAAESSFLSYASSNSSSSGSDGDMLNHSDTTELTASRFIQLTSAKQQFKRKKIELFPAAKEQSRPDNNEQSQGNRPDQSVLETNSATSRPPLSAFRQGGDGKRRHTISQHGPSDQQDGTKRLVGQPKEDDSRRESWHGPSPSASDRAKQFLSKMTERRQQRQEKYPRLSNGSVASNHSAELSSMQAKLREIGSPVIEDNRIRKWDKTSSPGATGVRDGDGFRANSGTESQVSRDRRETADTSDLRILLSDRTSSGVNESRRETANTSDLDFLSSLNSAASGDQTADTSDFDLRSPVPPPSVETKAINEGKEITSNKDTVDLKSKAIDSMPGVGTTTQNEEILRNAQADKNTNLSNSKTTLSKEETPEATESTEEFLLDMPIMASDKKRREDRNGFSDDDSRHERPGRRKESTCSSSSSSTGSDLLDESMKSDGLDETVDESEMDLWNDSMTSDDIGKLNSGSSAVKTSVLSTNGESTGGPVGTASRKSQKQGEEFLEDPSSSREVGSISRLGSRLSTSNSKGDKASPKQMPKSAAIESMKSPFFSASSVVRRTPSSHVKPTPTRLRHMGSAKRVDTSETIDSLARNTGSQGSSVRKDLEQDSESVDSVSTSRVIDSPARNTRSRARLVGKEPGETGESAGSSSPSRTIDSPAQNTRSRTGSITQKEKGSLSPSRAFASGTSTIIDSPARNTRSRKSVMPQEDKVSQSPSRTLETSNMIDSPARNTRSRASLKSEEEEASQSPIRTLETSNMSMVDSPARNTRSRSNIGKSGSPSRALESSSIIDSLARNTRSRSGATAQPKEQDSELSNDTFETASVEVSRVGANPTSYLNESSSNLKLNSSFRKAGRDRGPRRSVAFGSPEILQFNKHSPPMSATPMLSSKRRRRQTLMADDTIEIEQDMQTLLKSVNNPSMAPDGVKDPPQNYPARNNLFGESEGEQGRQGMESPDSPNEPKTLMNEDTVEIEQDMQTLLKSVDNPSMAPDGLKDPPHNFQVGNNPYEASKGKQGAQGLESPESPDDPKTLMVDDTVEIEQDMQTLLKSADNSLMGNNPFGASKQDQGTDAAQRSLEEYPESRENSPQSSHESDMSMDTTTDHDPKFSQEDETIDLALSQVPTNDSEEDSTPSKGTATQELEVDMANLLAQTHNTLPLTQPRDEDSMSGGKRKRSPTDIQTDGEQTVELEMNMEQLLNGSDNSLSRPGRESELSIDSGKGDFEPLRPKRRRSSVSSRSFSVGPRRRNSDSLDVTFDVESPASKTNTEQEERPQLGDDSGELEIPSLLVEEVLELLPDKRKSEPSDVVTTFHNEFSRCGSREIFGFLERFLEQVCVELERGVLPPVAANFFADLPKEAYGRVVSLQQSIRSKDRHQTEEAISSVASSIEKSKRKEWDAWLLPGANDLLRHTTTTHDSLKTQRLEIMGHLKTIEDYEKYLYGLESKKVRRVRRKSLNRRKDNAQALQNEVDEMAREIDATREKLALSKARKERLKSAESEDERHTRLKSSLPKIREEALNSERKWITIKKASVWQLSEIRPSQTSFSYIGFCPEACAAANLALGSNSELVCETKMHFSESSDMKFAATLPRVVANYAGRRNAAICSSIEHARKGSTSAIKANLRWQAWERCRLEMICSELATLHRRYKMTIEQNDDCDSVVVDFAQPGSSRGLLCSFGLSRSYPFGTLNTKTDLMQEPGDSEQGTHLVDLDALQTTITKNAKPGYGNLSRTIAVISAFVVTPVKK